MRAIEEVFVGEISWLSRHGDVILPGLGSTLTGRQARRAFVIIRTHMPQFLRRHSHRPRCTFK